jgi:hypothetical protein
MIGYKLDSKIISELSLLHLFCASLTLTSSQSLVMHVLFKLCIMYLSAARHKCNKSSGRMSAAKFSVYMYLWGKKYDKII